MRKPFVAGNWKMFKTVAEARHLVSELVPGLQPISEVEKAICPPYTTLLAVAALLEGTDIGLGAQNMYWEESGAYTGEIAPGMLAELCNFVILGHSERRAYFGESDEAVNRKMHAALAHDLTPIICVGETLAENEAGRTAEVVSRQLREGLAGLSDGEELLEESASSLVIAGLAGLSDGEELLEESASSLVIAYEPVWAIGTGKAATTEGANAVAADIIRPVVAELFSESFAQAVRVLYGGSVKANNAAEFFNQPDIDGALVGGASLNATEFTQIVQAAAP
jgi:triosephosphate isomerase